MFDYQNEKKISFRCKLCLEEFKIVITKKDYEEIKEFPIKKEFIHGDPLHKLILTINKNLEVEKFKIEDIIKQEVSISQELTKQVLSDIQLSDDEIEMYLKTTGRGAVSLGELSILTDKPKAECQKIAEKFIEKGLYKEISGATPHYFTLPPYAALVSQLQDFQKFVGDINEKTTEQLNQSFSELEAETEGVKKLQEFTEFLTDLKQNTLSQMRIQKEKIDTAIADVDNIKNITDIIANLENDVKRAIENQLSMVKKKKLKEELDRFFKRFSLTLKDSLERTMNDINGIVNTAETAKDNVRTTFADVSKTVSRVLVDTEGKIADISDGVSQSLNNIKELVSTTVVETLKDMLTKILNKLEISEITTKQFWEQAKQTFAFTMRDIWYVKSVAGIKSQIKDEISKSKMRLLILAPQLIDIDIEALKLCPTRVNIRIATNVDLNNPKHQDALKELDKISNVDIRLYEKQDLWGINKDSEVVIICAISRNPEGNISEIAGIGTATQEHIRIFVPVIEDAWMSASKHFNALRRARGL